MTSSSDNGLSEENRAVIETALDVYARAMWDSNRHIGGSDMNRLLNAARASSIPPGVGGLEPDDLAWATMILRGEKFANPTTCHPASVPGALAYNARIDRILAALGNKGEGARISPVQAPHVFLDCDGVLADFDAHGLAYFGKAPREAERELGAKEFWCQLEARGDFYRSMPLMPDAAALYAGVKHLHPTILTGCPKGNWAQGQKVAWAAEHFPGVPIITCRSADKRDYAKPGDVLIDDWPQHRSRWIEMGGVFINHHDAATSLAALWAHFPALQQGAMGGSELKAAPPPVDPTGGE